MSKSIFCSAVLVFASAIHLRAQDSLMHKPAQKLDSITANKTKSVDSIQKKLTNGTDSIGKAVNSVGRISQYGNKSLDSLNKKFHHHTDSLQKAFAAPMNALEKSIGKLTHKKDSLTKLNLPTASVTQEIDELKKKQSDKLNELNGHIGKAKKETLDKVSSLHLPPQAESQINSFTKNINGFQVPGNFFKNMNVPGLSMPSLGLPGINTSLKLPADLSLPRTDFPSLQKLELNSVKLPPLSQMQGSLGSEIKKLQSLSKTDKQAIEKEALNAASQNSEVKSVLKEEGQLKDMKKQLDGMKDPKRADSLAMQQLQPAVNHFAGKEKELTAAMDKVSQLKQKYSSVKSLAELPKRAPNPLKDKPWIERIVPGLNYFILSKNYTLVDFNPYIGWRFNPRFTAAIGWNQRVGFSHGLRTHKYDRVFGVRATASYLWTHGINFKIAPELMDAYVPTNNNPDLKHEEWVLGFYAGVRKDFPIYKSLKGYSEVMYNFTQKTFQNIYGDPVSFRFGMELKLKKKVKQNRIGMVNPSSLKNNAISPKDSFHIVRKEKMFGVIGIKGDTLVPVQYQHIKKFSSDGKLYFIVKKDKKFGAFSSDGKASIPVSHPVPATVKFEIVNRARSKYHLDKLPDVK